MKLLSRLRAELGVAGVAGALLLAAGAAFFALVLQPLEEENARLERRLEALPAALDGAPRPGVLRTGAAPEAQLAAFHAFLDRGPDAPEWLARVHALAAAAGLELTAADYRLQDTGTPLRRYEIVLPVRGSYGELRAFLDALLGEIPVLSLDGLSLARPSAQDARLRAELRLTLHLVRS